MRDEKGRYKKGEAPGRPKGIKSKTSQQLRSTIREFLDNNLPSIQAKFEELETKDQLNFLTQLLPYAIGKIAPIENKEETPQEDKKTFTVEIVEGTSKHNISGEQKAS